MKNKLIIIILSITVINILLVFNKKISKNANNKKTELIKQLIFTLKVYEIKYGISEEQLFNALNECSQNFLNEYKTDYYNE